MSNISEESIQAARSLVKHYRSIMREDILSTPTAREYKITNNRKYRNCCGRYGWSSMDIARDITGFGDIERCSLCDAAMHEPFNLDYPDCEICIYEEEDGCANGDNEKTHRAIMKARSIGELIHAFRARATHISNILDRLERRPKEST